MTALEPIHLSEGALAAVLSPRGGTVLRCTWHGIPILRSAADGAPPGDSACYPLVPFGNRVRGNRFRFADHDYELQPNMAGDPHYLHGEGWQSDWHVADRTPVSVEMRHAHDGSGIPYVYEATQTFSVSAEVLCMTLAVTNTGQRPMPFGIGFHPFFPLTQDTKLEFRAGRMRDELPGWLPGPVVPKPADLDFETASPLPDRWINNGFEDWNGAARITWEDDGIALDINADPVFWTAQLYSPGRSADANGETDHFAFEPMSHLANGHNMDDLGGLTPLAPGKTLSGTVRFTPTRI